MDLAIMIAVIAVALFFDYTNGFHDAVNAIATSISTRALTPRIALAMAAFFNFIGAFIGTGVAATVGKGIVNVPAGRAGLIIVLSALLGAIAWNLITWWLGLPSSSSHALIGGLVGATIVSAGSVQWGGVVDKVIIPMVVSPVAGFGLAFLLMTAILWIFRTRNPHKVGHGFRLSQTVSAAAL
ncbi:MAG: inorganic phosphate transporter, partial [Candidatus Nanopelagicales bacterium]